jgi:hypothetical protein
MRTLITHIHLTLHFTTIMKKTLLISTAVTTPFAAALSHPDISKPPFAYSHIPSGHCTPYTITVPITSENLCWNPPPFKDNFDVVDYLYNTSRKDSQEVFKPFNGTQNVTKNYTISATFCNPKAANRKDRKETTILLATSGLGYDGRYWAPTHKPEEYSFVEFALKAGYSVFWYDRIGTGKSQKWVPSLLNVAFINKPL